jgi:drug/metabolite transporter (DMT)-like permease
LFWTIIFGYFFFKETIGWKKVGSLISMILGLYLLLR